MCKSKNEPGGPQRCAGHARQEVHSASAAVGAARVENVIATQERDAAEEASVDTEDLVVNLRREITSGDLDPEAKAARLASLENANRALDRLSSDHHARAKKAKATQGRLDEATERLSRARHDYDATTAGVADLTLQINEHDRKAAQATRDDPSGESAPSPERAKLAERREAAEARLAHEATERNGAIADSADAFAASEERDGAEYDVQEGERRVSASSTSDEEASARKDLRESEDRLREVYRKERQRSMLQPFVASDRGDFKPSNEDTYGGIATGSRRVVGVDGKPRLQVNLVREVDGVRTSARVEFDPERFATPDGTDRASSSNPRRQPTTARIMQALNDDASTKPSYDVNQDAWVTPKRTGAELAASRQAASTLNRLFGSPADQADTEGADRLQDA